MIQQNMQAADQGELVVEPEERETLVCPKVQDDRAH